MNHDELAVNTLRCLSLDMITQAKSGHPGIALSAAPLIYTLFTRHLIADPENPQWINRDRFVLSAGHGSALLYATLHMAGYKIPMEQLKQFRQLDSLTPGHPEYGHTPGIDATAGPLGQGIAQAVGMAMAETHLSAIYPDGSKLINHYTYCLTGDGCLEEGISQEAISLAGLQKLNKLILLYDCNDCTLDGPLSNSSVEDVKGRFIAAGWNVLEVKNGNSVDEIDKALALAKTAHEKPTLILCHTIIGFGSPLAGNHASHGKAFSPEEVKKTKDNLQYPYLAFEIPPESYLAFKESFIARGNAAFSAYQATCAIYEKSHPEDYHRFLSLMDNDVSPFIFRSAPSYEAGFTDSTRNESQALLNIVAEEIPNLFGGSADVASSVMTNIKSFTTFSPLNRQGQNLNFGIREFGMAAAQNGLLLHGGLRTYVGCFLVFADYLKPAIRMAAMEKIPAIYLFSHDSIAVGEDGPTHQPIEQLSMLRTIPDVTVFRPADAIETAAAYQAAFRSVDRPTIIVLSRQKLLNNPETSFDGTLKGGYVVSHEKKTVALTLIATGSEVNLAVSVQKILLTRGIDCRVVSLPSFDRFDRQPQSYQDEVLGAPYEKRFFLEMGRPDLLYKYAKHPIGIDTFGASAPAEAVIDAFGFTPDKIIQRILPLL
jgi:transketolase